MGNIGGEAQIELEMPIEAVWKALADVEAAPSWQDGLDVAEALERDEQGHPTLVRTESDIKVRRIKAIMRFEFVRPSRVAWTQVEGDMKSVAGAWELEDLGGERTLVRYRLDTDPGRILGLVIRGPVEAATRELFVARRPGELKAWLGGRA